VGDGSRVVMLGDSVMLGAQTDLEALAGWAVAVDASVSRQVGPPYSNNGIDALAADRLPGDGRVVIHLGTNGLFRESQLDEIMQLLADVPRVVFLTVRIPNYPDIEAANNAMLAGAPSRYPKIVVVDWKGASDANPSWIGSDGIHLTGEGRQAYTALIAAAL
jgi:lysophospholipase L1-like esterase